jgi:hypothetical protein
MDPQKVLPTELYHHILNRLCARDLTRMQGVNQAWRSCAVAQIEDRWQQRARCAQAHRAQGAYAPVRLQAPDKAPYKIAFSPCGRQMTVRFVCQPHQMFGLPAYPPASWHDLVLGRKQLVPAMADDKPSFHGSPIATSSRPPQILSQAITGRLSRWLSGPVRVCSLAPDGDAVAWLSDGKAYLLNLSDSRSTPIQLTHPDHDKFTGWIDFSPDGSYLSVGCLVLESCIGTALFDFGEPRLY